MLFATRNGAGVLLDSPATLERDLRPIDRPPRIDGNPADLPWDNPALPDMLVSCWLCLTFDSLASPQYSRRRWARFADGAAIQRIDLEPMGEAPDVAARQVVLPGGADYETAEYQQDRLPAYLEHDLEQPQYTAATVEVERRAGKLRFTLIVSGEERIQHLADCILNAMLELQLVR